MSTTSSTHQPRRRPLLAALVVAGIVAAGGVVGVGWHESATSGTGDQVPVLTPPRPASFTNGTVAERNREENGRYFPNARVAEYRLRFAERNREENGRYFPNARVAEYRLERNGHSDGGQKRGRGDFLPTTGGGKTVGAP